MHLGLRRSRTLAFILPLGALEIVNVRNQFLHQHIFWHARWDNAMDNMENENVLNVTLGELPDPLKELLITTVNQY